MVDSQGVAGSRLIEPLPDYNQADSEKVIQGQNNTFIVMGRDRVTSLLTGYGGKAHMACGAIDIVAGRASSYIKEENVEGNISTGTKINPSPIFDASKIYISQKTDIDTNFNLVDGKVGSSIARAGIAIKSDAVRIIAREGIKLVTGTDPRNSRGGNLISVGGIDLIAGNNDSGLQPLVKGKNLKMALGDIIKRISELNGVVDSFLTYQLEFNSALMGHTHPDAVNIALGSLSQGNPTALANGSTFQSPQVIRAGTKNITALNGITKKDLISNKMNLTSVRFRYLEPIGTDYINSRHNNTN